MSDQQFTEILTRLGGLEGTTDGLVRDVGTLKTSVAVLQTDVVDLRRHMGVLHEEVLDRIKGLGEHDSLRQEMRTGFAELRQLFIAHTVPGEAADRHFASMLADHERRLQTLEEAKRSR